MSEAESIATRDGSMYVSRIGEDRRLDSNSQPQASAVVMKRNSSGAYGRVTMTEEDFAELGETGTAEEKEFASRAIQAIHNYESSPLMASHEPQAFARPETLLASTPQTNLAMAAPSPSP